MASIISINPKKINENRILPPSKIQISHENFIAKTSCDRQISFITLEGENRLREDERKGFCHSRFKADLVIEGLSVADLKLKDKVRLGTAIIEISEVGKECHKTCPAFSEGISCEINQLIFFGRIIAEGDVKIGNKIYFM
ncbi:MOSC domain-containing protein [Alkaliphilus transvaalensis]|uniref:MOSC domain-containing protein n=1 Tax=Alkaliphilus transvaalensis TaxID=114628 RepID=UPI00047ACB0A|nr:hypothetical protein [Alkaliphilus transvaalensis]